MDFSVFLSYNLLPWQWIAWFAFGLCIGLAKAGFGGLASFTLPIIALIFTARAAIGLVLPVFIFADILAVLYYRRHAQWKYILKLLPWTLTGFATALLVDRLIPVQAFKYLMGSSIIVGLLVMVWNDRRGKDKPPPSSWWFSALFGTAGGFSSMVSNAAGSLIAVFLLSMRLPKNHYVGTTAWFFLINNVIKLPIYIFVWKVVNVQTILFDLTLVPLIVAGAVLGIFLVKKIPELLFRKLIMILTLFSTILLFI